MNLIDYLTQEDARLAPLRAVAAAHPDARRLTTRHGGERIVAASANGQCDAVLFVRSCGCCHDAPLLARPYVTATGIGSDPGEFRVVEYDEATRPTATPGWRAAMERAGIPPAVVAQVAATVAARTSSEAGEGDTPGRRIEATP